jgi:hypothetical protein
MFKRLFLAVLLFASTAITAHADGILQTKQLQWRFPNGGTVPNVQVDSKVIAASVSDTTNWVGTDGLLIPVGNYNAAATDSAAVAQFAVYVDTSYSVPQGSFTATVQGSFGYDNSLFTVSSLTINPTTGTKFITIPIYFGQLSGVTTLHPSKWSKFPTRLRLVLSNAGTAWANCRVSFQGIYSAQ